MSEKKSFKTLLKIDKGNLNHELGDIAPTIYEFGLKQIKLEEALEKKELQLEIAESKIACGIRAKYKNVKNGPSETHVKDLVKANPEIQELKEELVSLRKSLRLSKLKSKSLGIKANSIENIGHNIRLEGKVIK